MNIYKDNLSVLIERTVTYVETNEETSAFPRGRSFFVHSLTFLSSEIVFRPFNPSWYQTIKYEMRRHFKSKVMQFWTIEMSNNIL